MKYLAVIAAIAAFGVVPSQAQTGDAEAGHSYAKAVCAACHAIEKTSVLSPDPEAPPFADIARSEGITGAALAVILQTPHRHMPDFTIPPKERADVIAYILTLQP
jgi:mono/diheme cytochrome c family protein